MDSPWGSRGRLRPGAGPILLMPEYLRGGPRHKGGRR